MRQIFIAQYIYNNSKYSVTRMILIESLIGFQSQIQINIKDQLLSKNNFNKDPKLDTHQVAKRVKNAIERTKAIQE